MSGELAGSALGLVAALAWAGNGLLIRAHGPGLHTLAINALRCSIAGVVFVAAWPLVSSRAAVPLEALAFLGVSMVAGLAIGDSLYFEAIKRIGVARAMPISMGYPVLAALGAVLLLNEPLGPLALVGAGLTLGGVYLVVVPSRVKVDEPSAHGDGYWRGVLLAAIAAIAWSCSTLLLRPALERVDVATACAIRMPVVGGLLWVAAARTKVVPDARLLRGRSLVAVLAMGVVTVLATACFVQSVALAGAGRAAVLTATSPLFGVPFSVWFMGERASGRLGLGTLCSVIGVICLVSG